MGEAQQILAGAAEAGEGAAVLRALVVPSQVDGHLAGGLSDGLQQPQLHRAELVEAEDDQQGGGGE